MSDEIDERIYKIELRQERFDRFKAGVEVVAIVLAGVWAFYQFIYEDKIKPFTDPPSLTVTTKLEKLGSRGPWQALRLTETAVNDGKIRVSILARTVTLEGVDLVDKPNAGGFVLQDGTWNVNHSYQMSARHVLQSHSIFYSGDARSANRRWWLQPGDTSMQTDVYFVRAGQYDVIRADVNYQFTKYDAVPAFGPYLRPGGETVLAPADRCVDYDESAKCPVTGIDAETGLSLW